MAGHHLLELLPFLGTARLYAQCQAGIPGLQQGQAEGEFDTPLVLVEADRNLVREVLAQAADVARRRRGGDEGGGGEVAPGGPL